MNHKRDELLKRIAISPLNIGFAPFILIAFFNFAILLYTRTRVYIIRYQQEREYLKGVWVNRILESSQYSLTLIVISKSAKGYLEVGWVLFS